MYACETEKRERRRSGGPWRNEGVQGQSEGTGLLSQPADEELIPVEIFFFFSPQREQQKKKFLRNPSEEL